MSDSVMASTSRRGQGLAVLGRRFRLGTILGMEIGIDASWFFIAILVTWSLATGVFPEEFAGLDPLTYWIMGATGALGLFASIVLHELSHSVVARRLGLEMRGITLFIFGGVAQMGGEPSTPRVELFMAAAGPIASIVIGSAFLGLSHAAGSWAAPTAVTGVLQYLGYINLLLAAFNLVPAFPLDGGRLLRALLWQSRRDLRWATRVASQIGGGFGLALIVLGMVAVLGGNLVAGIWYALIGLFVRGAARMSYQQVLVREALQGEPVRRFMHPDVRVVRSDTSLASLVEDFIYRDYHKMYPVVDDGRLTGCVTVDQVKGVPKNEWAAHTVGEVASPCTPTNTLQAGSDAVDALALMRRTGSSRLLVLDGERLAGILTLKDLLQFLATKVELEGA
ncbi:MAG TPA: site-2 protease family protein [Gemmatimonadales bacterium]|nr:site-2 protease family protein [Gemmatimonadales bacterium]